MVNELSRRRACRAHAIGRADERYNLSAEAVDGIARTIKRWRRAFKSRKKSQMDTSIYDCPEVQPITPPIAGRQKVQVSWEGRFYRVIYDIKRRQVVTFLPEGAD